MFLKKLSTLTLIIFFSIASVSAADIIYKWKDKSGNIKYTETRPAEGISYSIIKNRTSKAVTNDSTTADESSSDKEQKSDKKKAEPKAVASPEEIKENNCKIAKQNLAMLNGNKNIQVAGEDGKKRVISTEERKIHLAQAKKNIEEFCK